MRRRTFSGKKTLMMAGALAVAGALMMAPMAEAASYDPGRDESDEAAWGGFEEDVPDWYDPEMDEDDGGAPDYDYYEYESDDGHVYYLVLSDCTWTEAFERAATAGGYLVHIDGWTEYSTLLHKIIDFGLTDIRFRIGARRDEGSLEYRWIDSDGEPGDDVINDPGYWSWTRWITGGPSFYSDGYEEDVLDVFFYSAENRFVWNDIPDDIVSTSSFFSGRVGYIVEFDPDSEGYYDALGDDWAELDGGLYDTQTQSGE